MMDVDKTYTLNDVYDWDYPGVSLGVVGDPIEHSLSPIMHNAALEEMAKGDPRFKDWRYFKFNIAIEDFTESLKVFYKKKFRGLNLSLPHKVDAIKYIASVDEIAKKMEAVNTLILHKGGYRGINTDGYGLEAALKYHFNVKIKGKDIILLGAGGAARGAAIICLLSDCRSLWIGNRTEDNLYRLIRSIGVLGQGKAHGFSYNNIPKEMPRTGIMVNATSLGMRIDDPSPIELKHFDKSLKVYDMIYNPPQTALLKMAEQYDMRCANGLRMLVEQGVRSLEAWAKQKPSVETMWKAIK